jgi:hypothetical protein
LNVGDRANSNDGQGVTKVSSSSPIDQLQVILEVSEESLLSSDQNINQSSPFQRCLTMWSNSEDFHLMADIQYQKVV